MDFFENWQTNLFISFVLAASTMIVYNSIPLKWLGSKKDVPPRRYIGFFKPTVLFWLYYAAVLIACGYHLNCDDLLRTVLCLFLFLLALGTLTSQKYNKIPFVIIFFAAVDALVCVYFNVFAARNYFYSAVYSPLLAAAVTALVALAVKIVWERTDFTLIKCSAYDVVMSALVGALIGFRGSIAVMIMTAVFSALGMAVSKLRRKPTAFISAVFAALSVYFILFKQINSVI